MQGVFFIPHHNLLHELKEIKKNFSKMNPLFSDCALLKGNFNSARDAKEAFEKSGKVIELGSIEKYGSFYCCRLIHPLLDGYEKTKNCFIDTGCRFIPVYNAFCLAECMINEIPDMTLPHSVRVFQIADGSFEEKQMKGATSILLNTEKKMWVKTK